MKGLDRSTAAHLGEHPDGAIFTSLPRSGQVNAAQVLAERGDARPAYAGPDSVAAFAGCTPVTKESGKHRSVHFRWACNKRFRVAVTTFADNSRHAIATLGGLEKITAAWVGWYNHERLVRRLGLRAPAEADAEHRATQA